MTKRFLAPIMVCLFTAATLFAAPAEYYTAVLQSQVLKDALTTDFDIVKVENTQTFRCPGCYAFKVSLKAFDTQDVKILTFQTSLSSITNGTIRVIKQ